MLTFHYDLYGFTCDVDNPVHVSYLLIAVITVCEFTGVWDKGWDRGTVGPWDSSCYHPYTCSTVLRYSVTRVILTCDLTYRS